MLLPDRPGSLTAFEKLVDVLAIFECVHRRPEALMTIAEQLVLSNKAPERLFDELVAWLHVVEDVAPEHHAIFDELAAMRGRISGPSSVVLHSPALARPWNEISEYLHRDSVVEAQDAELAVVASALGDRNINISNIHVGVSPAGEAALMVLALSEPAPSALLEQLRAAAGIRQVSVLT